MTTVYDNNYNNNNYEGSNTTTPTIPTISIGGGILGW
jgi:hypothetical protein